jgi:ATP-dependent Clp protease ATP-binding subunit ClpC
MTSDCLGENRITSAPNRAISNRAHAVAIISIAQQARPIGIGQRECGPHLLLGLLREGEGVASRVLQGLEVDPARTRNEILKELDPNFTPPESEAEPPQEGGRKEVKTPALRVFGQDLTELARKDELDPVIGRKNEIERVIQILCRRTKNNPVLLGEAGVGKTAIVEGLAQEIATGKMPELLRDKRVITHGLDSLFELATIFCPGYHERKIEQWMKFVARRM